MASRAPVNSLLDLNDDALYLVCEQVDDYYRWACSLSPAYNLPPRRLLSVGLTCKRLHCLALPLLYAKLTHTDEYKTISHRPTLSRFISALEDSEVYAHHVRNVNIDKHVFPERDAIRLVALLPRLEMLDTLRLTMNKGENGVIDAFRDATVPGVKTLTIGVWLEEVISSFPNLKALKIEDKHHGDLRLWVGSRDLTQLRHLDLEGSTKKWTPELFSHLAANLPQLQHLGVVHMNNLSISPYNLLSGMHDPGFQLLSHFSQLRSLKVAHLMWFSAAWTEANRDCEECNSGRVAVERCKMHAEQTVVSIGRLVFEACGSLEKVWFDRHGVVACTRGENGIVGEMVYRAGATLSSPFDTMQTLKK